MFSCARTEVGDRNSAKIPGLCSSLPTYLYRQPFIERTERHEKSWESAGEGIITPAKGYSFVDFLRRIRAGDDAAALELVTRFESLIRPEKMGIRDQFRADLAASAHDIARFTPDSRLLAATPDGVTVWRTSEGQQGRSLSDRPTAAGWSKVLKPSL